MTEPNINGDLDKLLQKKEADQVASNELFVVKSIRVSSDLWLVIDWFLLPQHIDNFSFFLISSYIFALLFFSQKK